MTPGELVIEPPTLINLGFEWFIQGDDNRNASVAVSYRKKGRRDWKPALPLLRLEGERVYAESRVDVIAPNMFAGSILDLAARHGVRGAVRDVRPRRRAAETAERIVTVRTRAGAAAVRRAAASFTSIRTASRAQKIEPSFEGLMCAYNYSCAGTDWATSGRPRVRPGDTILVHAGIYKYNRYEYTNDASVNRTVPLDGTYYLTADGTPEMPIAIKAAGDGEVVFDGDGNFALFDVQRRRLHLLRGHDVPQRGDRHPGRHAVPRWLEGTDRQEEPLRERRRRRLHQLLRLEQLLHRRQHVHRPQRSERT